VPAFGEVRLARLSGAMSVCWHVWYVAMCGVGDVGRLFFPSRLFPLPASAPLAGLAARARAEAPLPPPAPLPTRARLLLTPTLDLRGPVQAPVYTFHDSTIFDANGLGFTFYLGALVEVAP